MFYKYSNKITSLYRFYNVHFASMIVLCLCMHGVRCMPVDTAFSCIGLRGCQFKFYDMLTFGKHLLYI